MAESRDEVETCRDGKYTDDMRRCCMSLPALNMGIKNVGPLITDALKLADRRPSKVPSYGLLQQMITDGRDVSLAQIGEVAVGASEAMTTEAWQGLSAEEQASMAKLYNHFCGFHMLVNLAE